jgi:ABC-type transporter Mla maintaining outer membrane lipid asymmetry ATPase subunit MlaF
MHLEDGQIPEEYNKYVGRKILFLFAEVILLLLLILSISPGAAAGGAGKTTLLRCLNRIVKPKSGSVFIEGHPVVIPQEYRAKSKRSRYGQH